MYKYKITNITDHQGIPKQEFFDELNEKQDELQYCDISFLWLSVCIKTDIDIIKSFCCCNFNTNFVDFFCCI